MRVHSSPKKKRWHLSVIYYLLMLNISHITAIKNATRKVPIPITNHANSKEKEKEKNTTSSTWYDLNSYKSVEYQLLARPSGQSNAFTSKERALLSTTRASGGLDRCGFGLWLSFPFWKMQTLIWKCKNKNKKIILIIF